MGTPPPFVGTFLVPYFLKRNNLETKVQWKHVLGKIKYLQDLLENLRQCGNEVGQLFGDE